MFTIILFQACQKDFDSSPIQNQESPQLPPLESLTMSFEGWENLDTFGFHNDIEIEGRSITPTFKNWYFAAVNLVVWNTAIVAHLSIPFVAFAHAFNYQAEQLSPYKYQWSYEIDDKDTLYSVKLTAEYLLQSDEIYYELFVSQENGFSDMKFISGTSNTEFTNIKWDIYFDPYNPVPFLNVEFETDIENARIRYTNVIPGDEGNGDYLEARTSSDSDYNRFFDVFEASENNFIEMKWNEPSRNGAVKSNSFFGDLEWHCWDQRLMDTDC